MGTTLARVATRAVAWAGAEGRENPAEGRCRDAVGKAALINGIASAVRIVVISRSRRYHERAATKTMEPELCHSSH